MPKELAQLFGQKEKVARQVEADYARLSVRQLNHKPSDGTHMPRWNAEHIMGRELGFFSNIYSHRSPMILPIDLNPPQTPPEYQPRHPDWTGDEEARQIERTQAFTRRFAYLLNGIEPNQTPKGSPWPLKKLFDQMAHHYQYHTNKLPPKFKLLDWPKD